MKTLSLYPYELVSDWVLLPVTACEDKRGQLVEAA